MPKRTYPVKVLSPDNVADPIQLASLLLDSLPKMRLIFPEITPEKTIFGSLRPLAALICRLLAAPGLEIGPLRAMVTEGSMIA